MRYWTEREKTYLDFDLAVCKLLADTLDRGDLIYTENGRFGLATRGEAKEGLMVALLSGSTEMSLLERKEGSTWYEYVDEGFLMFAGEIERLEQVRSVGTEIEQIEIR